MASCGEGACLGAALPQECGLAPREKDCFNGQEEFCDSNIWMLGNKSGMMQKRAMGKESRFMQEELFRYPGVPIPPIVLVTLVCFSSLS